MTSVRRPEAVRWCGYYIYVVWLADPCISHAAANEDTVAPAVEKVETSESLDTDYLPFESSQLTREVIANLTEYNLSDVELFDFQNATEALEKRKDRFCKTFPGDSSWPSEELWELLNLLSGSTVTEGQPPAAVCYADWPQFYDEAKCDNVSAKWSTPQYQ